MKGSSVTIVDGAFTGNAANYGVGYQNGSAYGNDLFLGADTTFQVTGSLSVDSLGGAGNISDPNVSRNAADPNAQGGVIKQGAGTLTLTGNSYYTGQTVIHSGMVALAAGALEQERAE